VGPFTPTEAAGPSLPVRKNAAPERPQQPLVVGLNVGNLAPDILGEDIDGRSFKLSDYRGKVVVIDFWGNW
jgi:hypothetical protein